MSNLTLEMKQLLTSVVALEAQQVRSITVNDEQLRLLQHIFLDKSLHQQAMQHIKAESSRLGLQFVLLSHEEYQANIGKKITKETCWSAFLYLQAGVRRGYCRLVPGREMLVCDVIQ